jgi:2-polyprenyl-6-methoxyphenol hydroxylase-like FAD-dependent oxidoreductase
MTCISSALVVGGGIAGLSAALALSRTGVRCEVVENADPTVGSSIGLSGRAADALAELGVYDELRAIGRPFGKDATAIQMRNAAGQVVSPGPKLFDWPGVRDTICIYRPALIRVLTRTAQDLGVDIRMDTTFSKIDAHAQGVTVTFTDGERRDYDLLIGADGINSATRETFFPGVSTPAYSGQMSIRWMAPGPKVEEESWYRSPVGRLGFYHLPIEDLVYCPAIITMPEQRLSDDEVRKIYTGLLESFTAPALVELRGRMTGDAKMIGRPFRWHLMPAPWYHGRVVLVGDAAHATTAHMGYGGGLAVEDAVVLAQCVRDAENVQQALAAFMDRRFDRAKAVVMASLGISQIEQGRAAPAEYAESLTKAFAAISQPY